MKAIMILLTLFLTSCAGFRVSGPSGGSATMIALGSKQSFKGFSSPYVSIDEYAADSERGAELVRDTVVWGIGLSTLGSVAKAISADGVAESAIAAEKTTALGAQKAGVATSAIRADTIKSVNPELVPIKALSQ